MNKYVIILGLVVAFVGLVAANLHHKRGHHGHKHHRGGKFHHDHDFDFDEDHDIDFHDHDHDHHRGGFHGFKQRHPYRHGHGHWGGKGRRGRHPWRQGHRHHHGGVGGGFGGFGGAGIRGSESSFGGVGSRNHLGADKFARGHDNSLIANNNRFDLDHADRDFQENEGLHKHQVINNDKTFVNQKTTGVNDVDGFRNVDGSADQTHLGAGSSGLAAHNSGGEVGSRLDLDRDFNAVGGQNSEIEAGVGGGVGGVF